MDDHSKRRVTAENIVPRLANVLLTGVADQVLGPKDVSNRRVVELPSTPNRRAILIYVFRTEPKGPIKVEVVNGQDRELLGSVPPSEIDAAIRAFGDI